MALSDRSRESLLPSFLYASSACSFATASSPTRLPVSALDAGASGGAPFSIQAPKEKIELYSPAFYAAYTAGGIASCGLTHMAITPLDLVKCNMQVGKDVILYALFRSDQAVAKGTIIATKPSTILRGQRLGRQYCEVVVTCVLKRDTVLPRSYGDMETLADANNMSIAWPYKKLKITNKASKSATLGHVRTS